MKKNFPKQNKIKKRPRKNSVPRRWGLAARLEHARIKGKQKKGRK